MKKIFVLVCFAFSVSVLSQTIKANKLVVNSATKSNAATRVVVQDSLTKEYHWILKSSIGGGSVPTIDEVLDAGNTSIDKSISITTASSSDYASLNYNQLNVSDGDYLGRIYKNSLQFVDNVANTTANFSKDGLQLITSGSTTTAVSFENPTGINSILIPDKSGTIAMLDDVGSVTLPEFQIAVGQVGDVFGSSSDLTYEGGDLKVLGVEVMTVDDGQPLDSDLTAIAALTTTSYGRGFLPLTDAAAARTYIGAGTGSGTVTSVTGVSGETTVASGTTTPVIGISSTYTTARDSYADAKVQNNMTASTTVAPSATAVSTEYNSASALTFSGPIDLSKKGGSYYAEHTQTGAITFSVSATTVGGLAQVTILANGSAINLVGGWINVGGEPVSTTNGTTNYMVIWQTNNKVFYSVKVY